MAGKKTIDQFSGQIDKLRKESVETVANANRIVSQGVQKLADRELKALKDYYQELVGQVKAARRGESIKDLAARQLDLMQDTVNKMIGNARESFGTVAEVRDELTKLVMRRADKVTLPEIEQVKAPARKALGKMKKAATQAEATAAAVVASLGDKMESLANPAAEAAGKALSGVRRRGKAKLGASRGNPKANGKAERKTARSAAKASATQPAAKRGRRKAAEVLAEAAPAPKARRGRPKAAAAATAPATPARRGRKPKVVTAPVGEAAPAPAKRGRKPKAVVAPVAAPAVAKKPRKARVTKPKAAKVPKTAPLVDSTGDSA